MTYIVELFECEECGARYLLVPYLKAAAPHSPDKSCRSNKWKLVKEDLHETLHDLRKTD